MKGNPSLIAHSGILHNGVAAVCGRQFPVSLLTQKGKAFTGPNIPDLDSIQHIWDELELVSQ